jgi:predicted Zn-dependent protease
VANSNGIRVAGSRTAAQLITVSMGPNGGTGYGEAAAVDATTIDPAAIGRQAADKARASANAVSIEPGDYPVVLEEPAVVDLLDMLGYLGFSALAVQEERSFFEPGKRIGSDLVTITDDGADPAGLPMGFDYEGVAKQRVELVERGLCGRVVYDAQTAARDGVASTGHGLPARTRTARSR